MGGECGNGNGSGNGTGSDDDDDDDGERVNDVLLKDLWADVRGLGLIRLIRLTRQN